MRILVTGASGFIGLNLCEKLLEQGHKIMMVGKDSPPSSAVKFLKNLSGALHIAQVDITNINDITNLFTGFNPDAVIHGASVTPGPKKEDEWFGQCIKVNIMGTVNILEVSRQFLRGRFLLLSSGAAYGSNAYKYNILDEFKTPCEPNSVYSISKYTAELLSFRASQLWGLDVVVARLSAAFGRWEYDTGVRETISPLTQIAKRALCGSHVVIPRPGVRDWLYGKEAGSMLASLLLAKNLTYNIYNISSGVQWSVLSWCQALCSRFPNFTYFLADNTQYANINFHSSRDRQPLSIKRINEIGIYPNFTMQEALDDYLVWLKLIDI